MKIANNYVTVRQLEGSWGQLSPRYEKVQKCTDDKMHRFRVFRYSEHDTSDMEATCTNLHKGLLN